MLSTSLTLASNEAMILSTSHPNSEVIGNVDKLCSPSFAMSTIKQELPLIDEASEENVDSKTICKPEADIIMSPDSSTGQDRNLKRARVPSTESDAAKTQKMQSPEIQKRPLLPLKCRCKLIFDGITEFILHAQECTELVGNAVDLSIQRTEPISTKSNFSNSECQNSPPTPLHQAKFSPFLLDRGLKSCALDLTVRGSTETSCSERSSIVNPTLTCPECKVSTTSHVQLLRHFESAHGTFGSFTCNCGVAFEWLPAFLSHYLLCPMASTLMNKKSNILSNKKSSIIYNSETMTTEHAKRVIEDQFNRDSMPHYQRNFLSISNSSSYPSSNNLSIKSESGREYFDTVAPFKSRDAFYITPDDLQHKCGNWISLPQHNQSTTNSQCKQKTEIVSDRNLNNGDSKQAIPPPDLSRPFKCCHCVKSFKSKALLDQHMHIHYPPKYTCRYCAKKYRWPPVFYHHQRTCKKRPPAVSSVASTVSGGSVDNFRTSVVQSRGLQPQQIPSGNFRFPMQNNPIPQSPMMLQNPFLLYSGATGNACLNQNLSFDHSDLLEIQKNRPVVLPPPSFGPTSWERKPQVGIEVKSMHPQHNTMEESNTSDQLFNLASAMALQLPFPLPLGATSDIHRLQPPPIFPFYPQRFASVEVPPVPSVFNENFRPSPGGLINRNRLETEKDAEPSATCSCGAHFTSLSTYLNHIGRCQFFGKLFTSEVNMHTANSDILKEPTFTSVPLPFLPLRFPNKSFPMSGLESFLPSMLKTPHKSPEAKDNNVSLPLNTTVEMETISKPFPFDPFSAPALANIMATMNAIMEKQAGGEQSQFPKLVQHFLEPKKKTPEEIFDLSRFMSMATPSTKSTAEEFLTSSPRQQQLPTTTISGMLPFDTQSDSPIGDQATSLVLSMANIFSKSSQLGNQMGNFSYATNLCSQCGKEFSSRLSLKQHVEGKHSAEGKYQCPGCAKRYRWGASYYYHKKSCSQMPRDSASSFSAVSPTTTQTSGESSSPLAPASEFNVDLLFDHPLLPSTSPIASFDCSFSTGDVRNTDEVRALILQSAKQLLGQQQQQQQKLEQQQDLSQPTSNGTCNIISEADNNLVSERLLVPSKRLEDGSEEFLNPSTLCTMSP